MLSFLSTRIVIPQIILIVKYNQIIFLNFFSKIAIAKKITYTNYEQLTQEEKRLIDNYRACSAEHKKSVSEICESFAEKEKTGRQQDIG